MIISNTSLVLSSLDEELIKNINKEIYFSWLILKQEV